MPFIFYAIARENYEPVQYHKVVVYPIVTAIFFSPSLCMHQQQEKRIGSDYVSLLPLFTSLLLCVYSEVRLCLYNAAFPLQTPENKAGKIFFSSFHFPVA
jgi:hypothetical protein